MLDRTVLADAERHLARRCPQMRRLVRSHGPCALGSRRRDPFHVLATSIISQQLSTRAADTIQSRVHAHVGAGKHLRPEQLLSVQPEALRACGLSNAKVRWLRALSERTRDGTLNFRRLRQLDDEAAIAVLDALPGVGRWTAEMFLIFALDRLDVFSYGDVGLRRGINQLFNDGAPLDDPATAELVARWAPYRSVASWYLWRMADAEVSAWN